MTSSDPAVFLHSLKLTTSPPNSPTSTILTSAITSSLTTLGYDPHLIQRVALLSTSNTHTVECAGLQALIYHPSRRYGTQPALAKLFDDIKAKATSLNSNEPVLVVNNLGGLDSVILREVADAAANLLRHSYHIRPVRVYAGNFTPFASEEKLVGYSISLLNVVNTDIGGPSMVQLLDMADWKAKGAVRQEAWDGSGWNLAEVENHETDYEDVKQEDVSEAGGSEAGEWESEPEVEERGEEHEIDAKEGQDSAEKLSDSGEAVPDATEAPEEAEVISDLPAEDPWSQRPQLREIKHPSWERTHDKESLLDMITKQSQKLPISKGGNAYATAASKEKAELSGEDEYEVV